MAVSEITANNVIDMVQSFAEENRRTRIYGFASKVLDEYHLDNESISTCLEHAVLRAAVSELHEKAKPSIGWDGFDVGVRDFINDLEEMSSICEFLLGLYEIPEKTRKIAMLEYTYRDD